MKRLKITIIQNRTKVALYLLLLIFSSAMSRANLKDTYVPNTGKGKITIKVYCKDAKAEDSLELRLFSSLLYESVTGTDKVYKEAQNPKGYYLFAIAVDESSGYFELYKSRTFSDNGEPINLLPITAVQFWENGDDITCDISVKETRGGMYSKTIYSGKGALKYNIRDSLDRILGDRAHGERKHPIFPDYLVDKEPYATSLKRKRMTFLDQYKSELTKRSYETFKTEIAFLNGRFLFNDLEFLYKEKLNGKPDLQKQLVSLYYQNLATRDADLITRSVSHPSRNLREYCFYKCRFESVINTGVYDPDWMYQWISARFSGMFRDQLLTKLLLDYRQSEDTSRMYADVLRIASTNELKKMVTQLQSRNTKGKLQGFRFEDINGKTVGLEDFKGKVKLIDFWSDGCGPCRFFYKNTLSKVEPEYQNNRNVVFISVSLDRSKNRWIKGIESDNYTSKEAMNLYTYGLGADHPFLIENLIKGTPTVLLIDKEDNIRFFNSNNLYNEEGLKKAIKDML